MAQSARDHRLETRSARLRLLSGQRYFKPIGEGLTLIYRRTQEGFGTWSAKLVTSTGKYALRALGAADDYQESDGVDVLTFWEAQDSARDLARAAKVDAGTILNPRTVRDATDFYLAWFRAHRKSVKSTEHVIRIHILPTLGNKLLDKLTTPKIREWLDGIATQPARLRSRLEITPRFRPPPTTQDEKRARRATANRILNVLKAILNRAFEHGMVGSDTAWRRVRPFANADQARIRFLTELEAARLLIASEPALGTLVRAALVTGARCGELTSLTVRDVSLRNRQIYISPSKSGRPRHIPLNDGAFRLFSNAIRRKLNDSLVFTRADGKPWGKHYVRPFRRACKIANIDEPIAFHDLRHSFASHLAQAGIDLLTISKLLGHADTRITSKHYAHLADATLAAAVRKLPSTSNH